MTSKQSDLWPAWSTSTGWWLSPTPLKNDGVKVSWDYEIPNLWKNKKCIKMFQTTNQSRLNQNLSHTCCESLPFDFRLVADAARPSWSGTEWENQRPYLCHSSLVTSPKRSFSKSRKLGFLWPLPTPVLFAAGFLHLFFGRFFARWSLHATAPRKHEWTHVRLESAIGTHSILERPYKQSNQYTD